MIGVNFLIFLHLTCRQGTVAYSSLVLLVIWLDRMQECKMSAQFGFYCTMVPYLESKIVLFIMERYKVEIHPVVEAIVYRSVFEWLAYMVTLPKLDL